MRTQFSPGQEVDVKEMFKQRAIQCQWQDLQGFQPAARNTQEVLIGHYAESKG